MFEKHAKSSAFKVTVFYFATLHIIVFIFISSFKTFYPILISQGVFLQSSLRNQGEQLELLPGSSPAPPPGALEPGSPQGGASAS